MRNEQRRPASIAMTNLLLIRHASHDFVNTRILGHTPGIHLNDLGRQQAEDLAAHLSGLSIDAVCSSPLERARETAEPLARRLNLEIQITDEFNEVNVGDWANRTFADLNSLPEWRNWNSCRSGTAPPNGEHMLDVQARIVTALGRLRDRYSCVAVFTHGDVIRAALLHFLGMHLDLLFRFQIDPGSVSVVQMHQHCAVVRTLNWCHSKAC
jgi:broad specificity phosphatase PhoE